MLKNNSNEKNAFLFTNLSKTMMCGLEQVTKQPKQSKTP